MNCCENCIFVIIATFDVSPKIIRCNCYLSPFHILIRTSYDSCYMHTKDFINDILIKDKEKE